ncbi:hypothetical protein chiPu_0032995, partial [Chiloscyllium punctatum]|nr:hypothetical protein [Chiloscyllium punctatum]
MEGLRRRARFHDLAADRDDVAVLAGHHRRHHAADVHVVLLRAVEQCAQQRRLARHEHQEERAVLGVLDQVQHRLELRLAVGRGEVDRDVAVVGRRGIRRLQRRRHGVARGDQLAPLIEVALGDHRILDDQHIVELRAQPGGGPVRASGQHTDGVAMRVAFDHELVVNAGRRPARIR